MKARRLLYRHVDNSIENLFIILGIELLWFGRRLPEIMRGLDNSAPDIGRTCPRRRPLRPCHLLPSRRGRVITTVTSPFCATCDRIRLTSQGRLHTYLFDLQGVDLLPLVRAGDLGRLDDTIRHAIGAKTPPARFQRSGVMAGSGG